MIKSLTSKAIVIALLASFGIGCGAWAIDAQTTEPAIQPFICDEDGSSTGSSQFISSLGHLVLNLSIAEKSDVQIGAAIKNIAGLPTDEVLIDYKGQINADFGPHLIFSYMLPGGKIAGRVVPFIQAKRVAGAPEGFSRLSFKGLDMGMQPGTVLRGLEILAIGENGGGSTTIDNVTINGVTAAKLMNTQSTCDFVP